MTTGTVKGRFELVRRLGAGGMGIVYEATDREQQARVALKQMKLADATALYRFKHEFRSLAELSHPNLVPLFELFAADDEWFFTMEMVDGVDFLEYVRGAGAPDAEVEATHAPTTTLPGSAPPADRPPAIPEMTATRPAEGKTQPAEVLPSDATAAWSPARGLDRPPGFDESRLRDATAQLVEGVRALHRAGKLHRDIKPSNVLVRPEGRVVLLDFGLVLDLEDGLGTSLDGPGNHAGADPAGGSSGGSWQATEDGQILGTVHYMAPEQATGQPLSEASDWYAVGVVLYRALTGHLPFEGGARVVLSAKTTTEPPPPGRVAPGIPADLDNLCAELLRLDPAKRPGPGRILEILKGRRDPEPASVGEASGTLPFVGRSAALADLHAAFAEMLRGRTVVATVSGGSGVGKSTLVRHFAEQVANDSGALVLSGRCYEQESAPYKGLDGLVDRLSRILMRMPAEALDELLPRSISGLGSLFPVLLRVPRMAEAAARAKAALDPQERRRHAFAALRALLANLGRRGPLVLVLDDLQWGDVDGAALLGDLLRPPSPPRLMLIATCRTEPRDPGPGMKALRDSRGPSLDSALLVDLPLGPLGSEEARTLVRRILEGSGNPADDTEALTDRIVGESQGLPYFLGELTGRVLAGNRSAIGGAPRLDEVLWDRVGRLDPESRRILDIVSVATRPIRLRDACDAGGMASGGPRIASSLRAARLLRRSGAGLDDEVEVYHDRIRETMAARLDPEAVRGIHERLLDVFTRPGAEVDPETLATHYLGAGRPAEAGEAYIRAADQAAEALAFDRAAEFYRLALRLWPGGAETARLRRRLAESLANAGRGGEAARAFLEASEGATPDEAHELRRQAAYQFCISGRIDEGVAILREVLRRVGMAYPGSSRRAIASLLWHRLVLGLRGLTHVPRPVERIDPRILARVDASWAASTSLTIVDTVRAADLQTRNLLLALRAGEPTRLARALAWEAAHEGVLGPRVRRRLDALQSTARAVAQGVNSPYLDAFLRLSSGTNLYFRGEFPEARGLIEGALQSFRDHGTGVAWEMGTARSFLTWTLFWQGDLAGLRRVVPEFRRQARALDDRWLETNLHGWAAILGDLADGQSAGARRALDEVMGSWTHAAFHLQHLFAMWGATQALLYEGRGTEAAALCVRDAAAMHRTGITRVQSIRVAHDSLLAQSSLMAAGETVDPGSMLRRARAAARRLTREDARWVRAIGGLATLAERSYRGPVEVEDLRRVIDELESFALRGFAAAARHRLGEQIGGSLGRELRDGALAYFADQQVAEPRRLVDLYAPRFRAAGRQSIEEST